MGEGTLKTRTNRTPKKDALTHSDATKAKALVAFRGAGMVVSACAAAGIGRQTWYDWIEADPVFAAAVVDAREDALDDLEKEAVKRAKEGSDTLLIFLLKSQRREKFGDRVVLTEASQSVKEKLQATVNLVAKCAPQLMEDLEKIWK